MHYEPFCRCSRNFGAFGSTGCPHYLASNPACSCVGLKGDEAKERDYYSRALAAGATGARERIAALAVK
jgi:hypothetical protein